MEHEEAAQVEVERVVEEKPKSRGGRGGSGGEQMKGRNCVEGKRGCRKGKISCRKSGKIIRICWSVSEYIRSRIEVQLWTIKDNKKYINNRSAFF